MCWPVMLEEIGVDPDDASLDLLLEVAHVLAELPQRRGAHDRGNRRDDPLEILVGHADT